MRRNKLFDGGVITTVELHWPHTLQPLKILFGIGKQL